MFVVSVIYRAFLSGNMLSGLWFKIMYAFIIYFEVTSLFMNKKKK